MSAPRWVWTAYALCVGLAALALAWLSALAINLERVEARTRQRAELDENVQLALWRMDSALAPMIAEEGARPYFTYSAFYPAEGAYTHMFEMLKKGDVLVASPLLVYESPRVRLHFQFTPDGRLTSPQVPDGNMRDLAETGFMTSEKLEHASRRFEELKGLISQPAVAMACNADSAADLMSPALAGRFPDVASEGLPRQSRGSKELSVRSQYAAKAQTNQGFALPVSTSEAVSQGPMQSAWVDDVLILGRRVHVGKVTFLQGCWLDWEAIRGELLASVADLLPHARLEPLKSADEAPTKRLAALPVRLETSIAPTPTVSGWSPVRVSLWIAWSGLAVAAAAAGVVLGGTLSLSERRGVFVSAVTHELRTPLTTFRLYTEMLSENMVNEPEKRASYLRTLNDESDRLRHLVENVLSLAQLERGRSITRGDTLTAAQLIDRIRPALAARAERGGLELVVSNDVPSSRFSTDLAAVEQVLSNLVDNAAKYARGSSDQRLHLSVRESDGRLTFQVEDHGPGLCRAAVRRLFRPFSKSSLDAAHSAPGVGLGLALSRRLARALGGDLRLERNGPEGACFALTLPCDQ